MQYNIW